MRSLILIIILFFINGCAIVKAKIPIVMPDNSIQIVDMEYIRWLNQTIEGFLIKTPSGWEVRLDKQGASNKASFGLGPYKITVGGSND